jgi:acyl-CoA synthetase (AMP-forming)/AMP-acid ligase II/uncharacterized membrane protein
VTTALLRLLQLGLTLLYPFCAHLSVHLQNPIPAIVVLAALLLSYVRIGTWIKKPLFTTAVFGLVLALIIIAASYKSFAILYLPPIIITSSLLWFFARTLLPGKEPLISAIARVVFNESSDDVKQYTRRVTELWCWFFVAMLVEIISLSVFASPFIWSLFCNLLNYLFIAVFFLAEYVYRCYRFKLTGMLIKMIAFFMQVEQNPWEQLLKKDPVSHPLFKHKKLHAQFAELNGKVMSCEQFLEDVYRVAPAITSSKHLLNLCENRYYFTVLFAASLINQSITLMPNNQTPHVLGELAQQYDACRLMNDADVLSLLKQSSHAKTLNVPIIPADQIAAVVFTSGSTGSAVAWSKTWGQLVSHSQKTAKALGIKACSGKRVVATVAAQHMYGLEHAVILTMQQGLCLTADKPFFVHDIEKALTGKAKQTILFSTPLQLKHCAISEVNLNRPYLVVSSTAKLSESLASKLEKRFQSPVIEVYGCTEAGAIATRRTALTPLWTLMSDYQISYRQEEAILDLKSSQTLGTQIALSDTLKSIDNRRFELIGRAQDNINIAGKRMNLADLNIKLNSIPGIEDGVFYHPCASDDDQARLIAFVVSTSLSVKNIRDALRNKIDPIFLPKRLHIVEALPRNKTGKLSRDDLASLSARHFQGAS